MNHLLNGDEVSLINMFRDPRQSYSKEELCFDSHHLQEFLDKMQETGYVTKDEADRYRISETFREEIRNRLRQDQSDPGASESAINLSNL